MLLSLLPSTPTPVTHVPKTPMPVPLVLMPKPPLPLAPLLLPLTPSPLSLLASTPSAPLVPVALTAGVPLTLLAKAPAPLLSVRAAAQLPSSWALASTHPTSPPLPVGATFPRRPPLGRVRVRLSLG